ncbi:MAG: 50S ribosomal protein L4 [Myxococcota bacterium]
MSSETGFSTVKVFNTSNEAVGECNLPNGIFAAPVKQHLIHAVVRKQLNARRQGTHSVKRRSDVSGGGRKPYKQKGTGRARQGSTRSPHFRGGGVVFGPTPRSYDFKVNKKEMKAALRGALSIRMAAGDLVVLDEAAFDAPKTKNIVSMLSAFDLKSMLLVAGDGATHAALSARNHPKVSVVRAEGLNVYDILLRNKLVMTRQALDAVIARLEA